MTPERKERIERYLSKANEYFSLKFSEAMFAGAILQAAYTAIRLYSRNAAIPDDCAALVRPSQKTAIPFCIGKVRHGVRTGLIVYAGRNQYNHWIDEEPHDVTKQVFAALTAAFNDNMLYDLAFELSNPSINIYAGEILLGGLGWRTYDRYVSEMISLLGAALDAPEGAA